MECLRCKTRVEACKIRHHREYDCESFQRVRSLIRGSNDIIDAAIEEHFTAENRAVAATVILYSGGNDSTTLAHLFKSRADYAAHCNTGIGIEQTRQFVRDTCASWGLPLIEVHPDEDDTYEAMIYDQGFPGPGHHFKAYQRLKERGLRKVRRQLVKNPRQERVLYLAGRRREESSRRQAIPESDRQGSIVFVSPLVHWTKMDLVTYRKMYPDVPRNEVSDTLHMSGECLCGAFAHAGELEEIRFWFPEVAAHIDALAEMVRGRAPKTVVRPGVGRRRLAQARELLGSLSEVRISKAETAEVLAQVAALRKSAVSPPLPEKKCVWGWGGGTNAKPSKSGIMCSSCDSRFLSDEVDNVRETA